MRALPGDRLRAPGQGCRPQREPHREGGHRDLQADAGTNRSQHGVLFYAPEGRSFPRRSRGDAPEVLR